MFFTYRQNNSGGVFAEPAKFLIVEASNADEADARATDYGAYFNGVDNDIDCGCCGDRWHNAYSNDGDARPTICGEHAEAYVDTIPSLRGGIPLTCIVYADGRKEIR
jgi:hypothetical protein